MANFYTYTSEGTMTLSRICQITGSSKSELFNINNQSYSSSETVSQYLQRLDLSGQKIPRNVEIRIPVSLTGGVNTRYSSGFNFTSLETTVDGKDTKYNVLRNHHNMMRPQDEPDMSDDIKQAHQRYKPKSVTWSPPGLTTGEDYSYVQVLLNGSPTGTMVLPVYPQEFTDSNSAGYSPVSILGRSVDYQVYQNSSRDVSFTLNLHEELCSSYTYIHTLVAFVESACYPGYSGGGGRVRVPELRVSIGSQFRIRGIVTSCSANWKPPIINGKLINCDLSIGVKETRGPYTSGEVAAMGGSR